jgi:hypothetical protein
MDDAWFDQSGAFAELEVARSRLRTVGFVGNCQARVLQKAFQRAAGAAGVASFYHFFDVPESERRSARADLADCDVVLMQDIQDLDSYPVREAIPRRADIVAFPFLRFASPWPYDDFNGLRDAAARAQDDPAHHTTTYYDGFLGRLRRLTPQPRARLEAYRSAALAGMIDPLRVHEFETRRLEALDARFGCAIGRFILDNFRHQQLFYTVNRPCGALLAMVLDHIFAALDLDLPPARDEGLDELRAIEVPVHPSVARRLGIAWADETRLYNVEGRRTDWEGFVRGYIRRYG